jgi:hypothetical protein
MNLGGLTFEDDQSITALQAADLVCWAVRRRATGYPFTNGYEPLLDILRSEAHSEAPIPVDAMLDINEAVERRAGFATIES